MAREELERAFAIVIALIKRREDGADFVPIAKRLEAEIMALESSQSDLERYRRM